MQIKKKIEGALSSEGCYVCTQIEAANTDANLDRYMDITERNIDVQQVPRRNNKRNGEEAYSDHGTK
ncbi:hypothetical protein ANTRET_LOCUS10995 [Anthophora retusa]